MPRPPHGPISTFCMVIFAAPVMVTQLPDLEVIFRFWNVCPSFALVINNVPDGSLLKGKMNPVLL